MESSRLLLALKLSTRSMDDGIREAAEELFRSPLFLASVALSITVYFAAWLAPEPFFSKAFAAALTVRLSLLVGLVELGRLAQACIRLYQEVEVATSHQEIEAASARFGRSMGGVFLRTLVVVAAGHSPLRKNKPQKDAADKRVKDPAPARGTRFRKPDASSIRPDGVRHNTNYVSNSKDMKRELEAFDSMVRADPKAIHELYLLDGTLVRRYIPQGVGFP